MKLFTRIILSTLALLLVSACTNQQAPLTEKIRNSSTVAQEEFIPEYDWPLASIDAINQDGDSVSLYDFQGKPWIMNMIFTNCTTVCLPMTANMAKLQNMLKNKKLNYQLVSYSVDPEIDTPIKLKEYAQQYDADLSNWNFLSGYSEEDLQRLAKSVKTLAEKDEDSDQVAHSTKFYLINQNGIALKGYDGVNPPFEEIIRDLQALDK